MDAVAAEAGTTKQTVYRYFGSKERLFVAVLESLVVERLRPDILSAVAGRARPDDELEDTLLTVANKILDRVLEPTYLELVRTLVAEARQFPELAVLFRTTVIEPMAAALTELIGTTQPEHAGSATPIQAELRLFIAPIINYELEAILGDPASVHKQARAELPTVVKLVAAAISATTDTRRSPPASTAHALRQHTYRR
jgi:TetR/AcrR family transcriptional repressor of mexJK operon